MITKYVVFLLLLNLTCLCFFLVQKVRYLETYVLNRRTTEEHVTITTNRQAIDNMSHSQFLLFLTKRLDIHLCRMCRNFESTPDNPDICKWAFLEKKCTEGYNKWLNDVDLEGEEDARLN